MRRRAGPVNSVIRAWHANPWTPLRRGTRRHKRTSTNRRDRGRRNFDNPMILRIDARCFDVKNADRWHGTILRRLSQETTSRTGQSRSGRSTELSRIDATLADTPLRIRYGLSENCHDEVLGANRPVSILGCMIWFHSARPDIRFILIEGDDDGPALTTAYARARRLLRNPTR